MKKLLPMHCNSHRFVTADVSSPYQPKGPELSSSLTTHFLAQDAGGGIDGAIQSVFGPFVEFLETAVFFSIPVLGADLPLVVVWLVAGGVFCNVYLRVRPLKDAK